MFPQAAREEYQKQCRHYAGMARLGEGAVDEYAEDAENPKEAPLQQNLDLMSLHWRWLALRSLRDSQTDWLMAIVFLLLWAKAEK